MEYGFAIGYESFPLLVENDQLFRFIKEAGFDYIEFPLLSFEKMEEKSFTLFLERAKSFYLLGPTCVSFSPSDMSLAGPYVEKEKITSYLLDVLPKAKRMGISKLLLGSGRARSYNEEKEKREDAFLDFSRVIKDIILPITKSFDMKLLIEPMRWASTNLVTSIQEGEHLVEMVDDLSFHMMVDLFHMEENGESLDDLSSCYSYIEHVHVASCNRGLIHAQDSYVLSGIEILKKLGYDNTLSFEVNLSHSIDELKGSLNLIKSVLL